MAKENASPAKKPFLASNQLAIYTLIALAVASLVGVLIPQEFVSIQPDELRRLLAQSAWARAADALGLFRLFSTGWFLAIVGLLVVNLVLCSVDGLKRLFTLRRAQAARKGKAIVDGMKVYARAPLAGDAAEALAREWAGTVGAPEDAGTKDARVLVAERTWWARLGPYVIHSSLLLIIAGAGIGQIAGLRGNMNILEGATDDVVRLDRAPEGKDLVRLPFAVRCDRFHVEFYPGTQRPKEFASDLTIVDGGREVLKKTIRVNGPLAYGGFHFFQANYGPGGGKTELRATDPATGTTKTFWAPDDEPAPVPGTSDAVRVVDFAEDHMNAGPAVRVEIAHPDGSKEAAWLFQRSPDFDATRKGAYVLAVLDRKAVQYTGLSVQQDPGVPVVWAGCAVLFAGLGLTFGFSHRRAAAMIAAGTVTLAASGQGRREPLTRAQRAILARLGVQEG